MSSSPESDKSEKTSKGIQWDNEAHMKLCVALNDVLLASDASVAKHKDVLMASLAANNADFTWEGVR
ncbi:hypothetical protein Sste5344_000646 [Sporothrix stenoceras]